jgi:hypothetical protein
VTNNRNAGLLAIGWRNHPEPWNDIHEDGKDSIREFVAAIANQTCKNTTQMDTVLKEVLPHFFDQRFTLPTARFGATKFWEFSYDFNVVAFSLINKGFVTSPRVMQDWMSCATRALDRYNRWVDENA